MRQNLAFLQSAAGGDSPCRTLEVEGGWYSILQVPRTRTEEEWCLELLGREGVLVQPGFFYDFTSEAFLVLSLLPEPAKIAPAWAPANSRSTCHSLLRSSTEYDLV